MRRKRVYSAESANAAHFSRSLHDKSSTESTSALSTLINSTLESFTLRLYCTFYRFDWTRPGFFPRIVQCH